MSFDVPVLLLTWRRPDTTRQVIQALRAVAPTSIYVASDGWRNRNEQSKVQATRELIQTEIDWPCTLKLRYSDFNQGCRMGVSSAITWFFQHEGEGIILEDDCVPNLDFFHYCSSLLDCYRSDTRVWCISGNNFQDDIWIGDGDYFFSQIPMCWGWATWSDRWDYYDSELNLWPLVKKFDLLKTLFVDTTMRLYWSQIWHRLHIENKPDSWAYRWAFTCVVNRGLTALPKVNLVSNIGFGDDATHTNSLSHRGSASMSLDGALQHPSFLASHLTNDLSIFNNHFGGYSMRLEAKPLSILWRHLRGALRRIKCFVSPYVR